MINEFLSKIKLFVLDMDGTVYIDDILLNGALNFVNYLKEENIDFLFFTNNSSKSPIFYIEKLHRLGIDIDRNQIMTSVDVTISYLQTKYLNKEVFVLGTDSFMENLSSANFKISRNDRCLMKIGKDKTYSEKFYDVNKDYEYDSIKHIPDIVLISFDTQLDYRKLNLAAHYVRCGALFLATHSDINCPCEYGFMVDCGAICDAIYSSTKIKPLCLGKPSKITMEMISNKTGYKSDEICFVGDRLYTDIACGINNNAYAALVLSGETNREMLQESEIIPNGVFDDLQDLLNNIRK